MFLFCLPWSSIVGTRFTVVENCLVGCLLMEGCSGTVHKSTRTKSVPWLATFPQVKFTCLFLSIMSSPTWQDSIVAPFSSLWLFEFWYHYRSLRLINQSRSVGKGALWKLPLSRLRPAVHIAWLCSPQVYFYSIFFSLKKEIVDFLGGSVIKNLPASAEDRDGFSLWTGKIHMPSFN